MISILIPTRNRPDNLRRMHESVFSTAAHPEDVEFVCYVDDDDPSYDGVDLPQTSYLRGPRIVMSDMWNKCCDAAQGPYYMQSGDDVVFRTPGWDKQVVDAFPPDNIAMVHGDDLGHAAGTFGTHNWVHQRWVDIVGYFTPPYFSSDYGDTWLNDLANLINRRVYIPIITEHMHPLWGKGPWDQTHQERLAREQQDRPGDLYARLASERIRDASKLMAVIELETPRKGFFQRQQEAWANPPLDDIGYIASSELLTWSDDELKELVGRMETIRYMGWRNHDNRWREVLGLDTTHNAVVMDFGCGNGIEALQFAKAGNKVIIADIAADNLALARRVVATQGYKVNRALSVTSKYPFFPDCQIDVFYSNGVIHHIPWARDILLRATEVLKPGGEIRLMLYSDIYWKDATGTPVPPVDSDVRLYPEFRGYVQDCDGVGEFADWYNEDRIEALWGDFLTLERYVHLTENRHFGAAILRPKSSAKRSPGSKPSRTSKKAPEPKKRSVPSPTVSG